jgi:hypothetical protein
MSFTRFILNISRSVAEMTEREQGAREAIVECLGGVLPEGRWCEEFDHYSDWLRTKNRKYAIADKILSLKDSEGKPLIAVLSKDQEVPKNPYEDRARPPMIIYSPERHAQAEEDMKISIARYTYERAQQDMLKAGFRRIEEKNEN